MTRCLHLAGLSGEHCWEPTRNKGQRTQFIGEPGIINIIECKLPEGHTKEEIMQTEHT